LIKNEHNAWIHIFLLIVSVFLGFYFEVDNPEWCLILLCIGAVLAMETINTAIEKIANFIQPEYDEKIKDIKDLAAGAVLIVAIISLVIGLIIFLPKFGLF